MLTNTYVGIQGVDRDTVEAARGMGMTGSQILLRLELPLAVPVILAGIRTAVLQVVATATLSALIGGGTLGRYIVDGLATNDTVQTVAGAVLIVVLSLSLEAVMAAVQRASSPRVSSSGRRRRATAAGPGIAPAIEA
jgi:osmoprotectant transport system permease protein